MNIQIHGKHMTVSNALQGYVEEKLGRLEHFFEPLSELNAQVTLSVVREQQSVEVTITMGGIVFRAEETTGDMYASIDLVADKLHHQIVKYKSKLNHHPHDHGTEARV